MENEARWLHLRGSPGMYLKFVFFHVLPIPVKAKFLAALSLRGKLTLPCWGLNVLHGHECVSLPPQQVALSFRAVDPAGGGAWLKEAGCPVSALSHGAQGSHRPLQTPQLNACLPVQDALTSPLFRCFLPRIWSQQGDKELMGACLLSLTTGNSTEKLVNLGGHSSRVRWGSCRPTAIELGVKNIQMLRLHP